MGVYGTFDTKRVADKTAHQGLTVLSMRMAQGWSEEQKQAFANTYRSSVTEKSAEACALAKSVGAPTYYPAYMINHGIDKINGSTSPELVPNFNSKQAWEDVLKSWLHCSS